ncbi:MAG: chemotaxis protein CheB [Acidobacteria bacterium]|nr:MAG: chemotaxis protein CheB [Acidobacteriota bacterium]
MRHDIIVIGGSAGALDSVRKIVASLPPSLPASIFIVIHISPHTESELPSLFNHVSQLRASQPRDNETFEKSHIYIAPPDLHMMLEKGRIRVLRGPKENMARPAIDVLFRSAAQVYGQKVIGVILSGTLDDGAAGLRAVQMMGGTTVVQDPVEALHSGMPLAALNAVNADHCLQSTDIGKLLMKLVNNHKKATVKNASGDLETENESSKFNMAVIEKQEKPGRPSVFSCPDCKGVLWEIQDGVLVRYRCRTGHGYSPQSLAAAELEKIDEALWTALTALEESAALSQKICQQAAAHNQAWLASHFEQKSKDSQAKAQMLRKILIEENTLEPVAKRKRSSLKNKTRKSAAARTGVGAD